jgi:hypothetical protein
MYQISKLSSVAEFRYISGGQRCPSAHERFKKYLLTNVGQQLYVLNI